MARIITTEKINEIRFYQMPKAFFHNPLYTGMKNESKIAYAILRDLLSLSLDNNWVNDKNEVYVKLSRDKMMKRLNIKGNAKYAEIMKELIEKELIVKRRVGLKQVDETYVCLPEELSVIYSDKELLELENTDVSLKFENQTSRSSKIEPQEVRKSNDKKFENQTHIDTNSLDTNSNDTNINTSSSSKGETPDSIHPLVELFNDSICELKKTTTIKFMKYVEKYDKEFIEAIIAYCEERNAKSFSYFQKTIDRYISEDITTVDALNSSIENFKEGNKTKKNNALKAKDEARKEKEFEDTINENILEDMINNKNTVEEAQNKINDGENVNELKELLKKDMTDVQFKTWIAGLDFKLNANELFIVCPNSFTKDVLVKRYEYIIKNAVKQVGLNVEIEYVVS
jgi:hypothetical protein